MKQFLFILTILTLLSSCIGKVEDANSKETKGINSGDTVLNFEGIVEAVPIAPDKVEVYFAPSTVDAAEVTYVINYDGAANPITVPGETLIPDYRGLLRYTVNDLNINTSYLFNVQAQDSDGVQSVNDALQSAKTFSNETANFFGVGNVRNLSGGDSKNSLLVEWPAAEIVGGFIPDDVDPSKYEVILINSDLATPIAFDDDSFSPPARIVNYVSSSKVSQQINGLLPGTIYYVRVRAIHHGYSTYGSDPDYLKESNNRYLIAETLSDDASEINVDLESLEVEVPADQTGRTSLNLSWSQGVGAIDHYRVYYKENSTGSGWSIYKNGRDDICNGQETSDPAYFCKKVSFDVNQTKIVELESYTDYEVYLLLCLNSTCTPGNYIEYTSSGVHRTSPPNASFSGITEIKGPKNFWALNEVYLQYDPVDLSTGVLDGLLVEVKARSTGEPSIDTFINHPDTSNPTSIYSSEIDLFNDDEVSIRGVDMNASEEYCFSLIPYVYIDNIVTPNRSSEVTSCILPRIVAPTVEDFGGFVGNLQFDAGTGSSTVSWLPPEEGVFDRYVIFVKVTAGPFSFSDAVNGHADYLRYEIDYTDISFTLSFMPSGNYTFGILTYLSQEDLYSEYNSGTQTVSIP
ncbi:hypothetical protein [Halobacteriovorax sp.]|uniref:hypothetical protein n=1 Tax=Halobacteriovorax sp. TaxID=2020862 RepID=UPI003AF21AD7